MGCLRNVCRALVASVVLGAFLPTSVAAEGWPELRTPPALEGGGENDAAVVVGIEDYAYVGKVAGAKSNALAWYAWLTTTLGLPAANAKLLLNENATNNAIRREVAEKLTRVKPGGSFWFIFIGHGAPAADGKDGVLVGPDAQQSVEELYDRSVRQRELFDLLPKGKQAQAIFVIDACFSGKGSTGSAIAEGLQPLIALRDTYVGVKKTVVLTAGTGKQFAGPLPGVKVPAFSYLMLGGLRGWADADKDNKVTAAEAVQYANDALAATLQGRNQTPELNPATSGPLVLARLGGPRERGPNLNEVALWLSNGVGPKLGSLIVNATPNDVRLEFVDPEGKTLASGSPYKNAHAIVGTWQVVATARGYQAASRTFQVAADDITAVKLDLNPADGVAQGPGASDGGIPWRVTHREQQRVYVRMFMNETCVAELSPGGVIAKHLDLIAVPYGVNQLMVRSGCDGSVEVYWGTEEKPRVSETFRNNQSLFLKFR